MIKKYLRHLNTTQVKQIQPKSSEKKKYICKRKMNHRVGNQGLRNQFIMRFLKMIFLQGEIKLMKKWRR